MWDKKKEVNVHSKLISKFQNIVWSHSYYRNVIDVGGILFPTWVRIGRRDLISGEACQKLCWYAGWLWFRWQYSECRVYRKNAESKESYFHLSSKANSKYWLYFGVLKTKTRAFGVSILKYIFEISLFEKNWENRCSACYRTRPIMHVSP